MSSKTISGFSKKSKSEKIDWLVAQYLGNAPEAKDLLTTYWHPDHDRQQKHDEFIENTLSNFYMPYAVAPNFMINGAVLALPMVIEESSVVAAASYAAKFWMQRGGFSAAVISTTKSGQIHLIYSGAAKDLMAYFERIRPALIDSIEPLSKSMKARGGGLKDLVFESRTKDLDHYYLIEATFDTKDAMGANFINSCLEQMAATFTAGTQGAAEFLEAQVVPEVVMSILSNYVPECLVRAQVSCPVTALAQEGLTGQEFAEKFVQAIRIAETEPRRAVTHNKGIMNGVDALVLATGNDFRAVEAGVHAYAAHRGHYQSLSHASIQDGQFTFWLELPLALGTVGGLTKLHPLVQVSMALLGHPDAPQLMRIIAVAGLAQNFAAIRSLVTTGIQKGHMKMHLLNLLNQAEATDSEKESATAHFKDHEISNRTVVDYIDSLRK
jgi:hydroxymethylglutaryl-CoA reductase